MKKQVEDCGCVNYGGNGLVPKYCAEHLSGAVSHSPSTPEWEIEFEKEFASLQYAFAPEVYAETHKQHLKDFIRKQIAAAQYRNAEYDEKLVDEARRDGYKAGADETRRSAIREFSEDLDVIIEDAENCAIFAVEKTDQRNINQNIIKPLKGLRDRLAHEAEQ